MVDAQSGFAITEPGQAIDGIQQDVAGLTFRGRQSSGDIPERIATAEPGQLDA
jgi:hypothetical protein